MADHLLAYDEVATNYARLASNSIARFMEFLETNGMNIEKVRIAGHR